MKNITLCGETTELHCSPSKKTKLATHSSFPSYIIIESVYVDSIQWAGYKKKSNHLLGDLKLGPCLPKLIFLRYIDILDLSRQRSTLES